MVVHVPVRPTVCSFAGFDVPGQTRTITDLEHPWLPAPCDLALSSDDVHIWRARLDQNEACVDRLQQVLWTDEQARARRFRFDQDRRHFIVARGVLRLLLSRYLDREPGQVAFCYSSYGKPSVITIPGQNTVGFNVSHSHGLALYAITRERRIGIDIERIRTDFAYKPIAERFFSAREKAMLATIEAEQVKRKAFFDCWARKEAYIKAKGEGLSLPLDQFDVSLAPGEPAALLQTRGDPLEGSQWSLHELHPGPGYAAALAVEGRGIRLACWEWRE